MFFHAIGNALLLHFQCQFAFNSSSHCRYYDWLQRQNKLLPNGTKMNWKSLVISYCVIPDLQEILRDLKGSYFVWRAKIKYFSHLEAVRALFRSAFQMPTSRSYPRHLVQFNWENSLKWPQKRFWGKFRIRIKEFNYWAKNTWLWPKWP